MEDLLNATALGAGSSIVGSALGMAGAKLSATLQQKNWKKQFDLQNAYNHPKAQLERLYDAGINPLYNSDFSGNSAAAISAAAPAVQPNNPAFTEDWARVQQTRFNTQTEELQKDLMAADARLKNAEAQKSGAEAQAIPVKTAAECRESNARVAALLSEKHLNEEKVEECRANIRAQEQFVRARRDEVDLAIRSFTWRKKVDRWNRELQKYANVTDRITAMTGRMEYNFRSGDFFKWQKDVKNTEFSFKDDEVEALYRRFLLDAQKLSDEEFDAMLRNSRVMRSFSFNLGAGASSGSSSKGAGSSGSLNGHFGVSWSKDAVSLSRFKELQAIYQAGFRLLDDKGLSLSKRNSILSALNDIENEVMMFHFNEYRREQDAKRRSMWQPSWQRTDSARGIGLNN